MKLQKLKELNLPFIRLNREQKLQIKGGVGNDDILDGIGNDDIEVGIGADDMEST